MKKLSILIISLLIILLASMSCSVTKKRYSSGFHIEWNKNPNNNSLAHAPKSDSICSKLIKAPLSGYKSDNLIGDPEKKINSGISSFLSSEYQMEIVASAVKFYSTVRHKKMTILNKKNNLSQPKSTHINQIKNKQPPKNSESDVRDYYYVIGLLLLLLSALLGLLAIEVEMIVFWLLSLFTLAGGAVLFMSWYNNIDDFNFFKLILTGLAGAIIIIDSLLVLAGFFVVVEWSWSIGG